MNALDNPNVSKVSSSRTLIFRCCLAILFSFFAFFLCLLFMIGFFAALTETFYISTPTSVAAECKIVSSGVDLRSIKVEYKEHSSGQTFHALAEAPKEALPIDCRPSFGTAWMTKDKFKVNKTYDCHYTPGITKVDIYSDNLFNCQAKDTSSAEMMKRYSILMERILNYLFPSKKRTDVAIRESLAGLIAGVLAAFMSMSFVKLLQMLRARVARSWEARKLSVKVCVVCLMRACFIVIYMCIMSQLIIQYVKWLGLPVIFLSS